MLGLALEGLFFGLLPLKVKKLILRGDKDSRKLKQREMILSSLLCFGAGVLLATVFIHMLPKTRSGFQKALSVSKEHETPDEITTEWPQETDITMSPIEETTEFIRDRKSALHNGDRGNSSHDQIHNDDKRNKEHECIEELSYPFAELAICAGFFIIYFIEELVHKVRKNIKLNI